MVGILALQRAHQEFKLWKPVQTLETAVFQKKRPARESAADTPLKPFKSSFESPNQGENARDLTIGVVRVPK
jgi:hypothetical protein